MRNTIGRKLLPFVLLTTLAACFNAAPAFAQFNPIQAAKDAWNKAKQQQQQGQQPASQPASAPANTSSQPSSAQPANSGAQPAPSSTSTGDSGQGGGAPWKPPSDTPAAAAAPAGPLDPAKLPDVVGIHMGMPREEVPGILLKLHPGNPLQPEGPDTAAGLSFSADLPGKSGGDNIHVEYTLPPDRQRVYYIYRYVNYKELMPNENIIASLRQKYGKETLDTVNGGRIFMWLFDEQGHAIPPDKNAKQQSPYGCSTDDASGEMLFLSQVRSYTHGGLPPATFCDSVIMLTVQFSTGDVSNVILTTFEDKALLRREVTAAGEAAKAEGQRQQQQQLKNAQQTKPNL